MTFDLDAFLSMPRLEGLAVSPDGQRLVTSASLPNSDGTAFASALWEVDPTGERQPRRLTRSAPGEATPAFAPDGSLLFTSARPDPDAAAKSKTADDDKVAGLWLLPAEGGEARLVAAPPGGVGAFAVARDSGSVALVAKLHPNASSWESDSEREQALRDVKVTAQLFESYPFRYWDRWFGPRQPRLHVGSIHADGETTTFTDVTPEAGFGLEDQACALTPDGRTVVTGWWTRPDDPRERVSELVALRLGEAGDGVSRRVLAREPDAVFGAPACSPDGRLVACLRQTLGTPDRAHDQRLVVVDLDNGESLVVADDLDLWPKEFVWAPDSSRLYFTADEDGRVRPFRLDLAGEVVRLATDGAYSDLTPAPDGSTLYALRADVTAPPHVVALDPDATDGEPRPLRSPATDVELPGLVERVETTASDGTRVAGWLVMPRDGNGGCPLVVFIHGGPYSSWAGWHWRWNPHLLAAHGYAVLCPDPATSTGYGQAFVQRGWGRWGAEPYTDLLALVDATEARADIDADRTAAMGGSFGGYMANWIAGHTDRFDAIVTHASLWNLEAFHGATDVGPWWEREFGDIYADPSRYREWSPRRHVANIRTPMLVVHGERDFRVPVSEGLALWTDLTRHGVDAKYLHFPDENHWILKPQNARIWYATVLAFLDHHVLGKEWSRPELL